MPHRRTVYFIAVVGLVVALILCVLAVATIQILHMVLHDGAPQFKPEWWAFYIGTVGPITTGLVALMRSFGPTEPPPPVED